MTVIDRFYNWQNNTAGHRPSDFGRCSPNLEVVGDTLQLTFGMPSLGCLSVRQLAPGRWSTHAFGAANDRSYADIGRHRLDTVVLPWLTGNSHELGVQAIHDYAYVDPVTGVRGRVWRPPGHSGRPADGDGWKSTRLSDNYLGIHIETHPTDWSNTTSITDRFPTPPPPDPDPEDPDMLFTERYVTPPDPADTPHWPWLFIDEHLVPHYVDHDAHGELVDAGFQPVAVTDEVQYRRWAEHAGFTLD